ncbi:hypothetical protein KC356_g9176 [Hortaea werneckii]|nr:hypothetical protein KC356_g9176 [Hortaea werneckii]
MQDELPEDETRLDIRDVARPMHAVGPDSSSVHEDGELIQACLEGNLGVLMRALPGLSDNTFNNVVLAEECSSALRRGDYGIALYLIIARKLDFPDLTAWDFNSTVVFQIFFDLGGDIDASLEYRNGTGSLRCLAVEDIHLTSWFLEQGADPNGQGNFTPLMAAAEFGTLPCLQLLVDYGGDLERANPLQFAALRKDSGGLEVTDWLLSQHVNVNTQVSAMNAFSSESGLDRKYRVQTPLHVAVRCGSYAIAALLLEHKADPSLRDSAGMTPLDCLKEREDEEGVTDFSRWLSQKLTRLSRP